MSGRALGLHRFILDGFFHSEIRRYPVDRESPNLRHAGRRSVMTQALLKQSYFAETISCSHCRQEQVVHLQAHGGFWSLSNRSNVPSDDQPKQNQS